MLGGNSRLCKFEGLVVIIGSEGRSSWWVPGQDTDKQARP